MNIKEVESILTSAGIEVNEAKIEAQMLVKHFLGVSDIDLVLNNEIGIGREDLLAKLIEAANLRARTRKPIQQIIGKAHFMGEDFIVNEHVLIPRDETEILVRKAVVLVEKLKGLKVERKGLTVQPFNHSTVQPKVLDIGTGSGCIACKLAQLTDAQVIGVDISTDALRVALDNASKLELNNKAIFRKSDIFSNIKKDGKFGDEKFDLIVSNPPYIPPLEKERLQPELKFEPESALFAKDSEGIEFYDRIIRGASDYLREDGYLLFELGTGQADKVEKLMEAQGFKDIKVEKDLANIERIIWGVKGGKWG